MYKNSRTIEELADAQQRIRDAIAGITEKHKEDAAEIERHRQFVEAAAPNIASDEAQRRVDELLVLHKRGKQMEAELQTLRWELEGIGGEIEALTGQPIPRNNDS